MDDILRRLRSRPLPVVAEQHALMYEAANEIQRLRHRWIPVTERMPDNGVEVLTWNPTGPYQTVACWVGNEWSSGDCRADAYDRFEEEGITHWMPLPAPPTDGK
jgi:hypothetical protein